MAMQKVPKIMYVCHWMLVKDGGTKKARARLKLWNVHISICLLRWSECDLHPVARSGEADTLGAVLEGEDFTGVDPSNGCPGETVDSNEDVCQSNDSLCGSSLDGPSQDFIAL
jgi:hypothetical protein